MRTACFTTNLDNVGAMNCNPSIGGPAKGHLVREIDALGGQMALTADATFLQMRLLNSGKGPAVQALRAQIDKRAYAWAMRLVMEQTPNLDLKQGMVQEIVVEDGRVQGIITATGLFFAAKAVVLSTGTYLHGKTIVGEVQRSSGPGGLAPAVGLTESLKRLGFEVGRFKTGTPPRVDGRTVDFSRMVRQDGDPEPHRFSFMSPRDAREQLPCWQTYTTPETPRADPARTSTARRCSAASSRASGPRYCPSVEDKVVRFADKERHQVFLEPEGWEHARDVRAGPVHQPAGGSAARADPARDAGLEEVEMMRGRLRDRVRLRHRTQLQPSWRRSGCAGLFCARPDQRHLGLRGGGRPGADRRHQRRAARSRGAPPLVLDRDRGVHRRADRRPGDQGGSRAVPDVHLAGRVPPAAEARTTPTCG